mmetsp:Transcript_39626/g.28625  ORF Transcript_39626/g.28625 Transcript_39626/m.28625 type:complete len:113 (+) Transcript_39626:21-359(+)|eukprot:CAMPEP_0116927912 /NCGR_PEP_ID=MMETSP0467-20121206/25658_1 /TAXON_ID=283647 /ORGANISM="Mesodinium pulex, Strain SPMC105" /LENGTH=112 /DNA_ID=CAMNT_0004607561 /DNA_START=25 /DNA_END=363 /DNA_ORIENTATION=+
MTGESNKKPCRLHVKATILGFKRGRRNTYHHTNLLKIEGCNDKEAVDFYVGKKIAYIYRAKAAKAGSKFRCVWGKVTRGHGSNGVVRAKFSTNLSPTSIGSDVRVMLYPSRV